MHRGSCCRSTMPVHLTESSSSTHGPEKSCDVRRVSVEELQPTAYDTVMDFFFDVRCACNDSVRFKHALVLTSLPFGIPAYLLLLQGTYFLGTCAAAVMCTSIAYHSLHWPAVRAADVLLVWVIGCAGTVQGIAAIAEDASYPACLPFALALCGVAALFLINAVPAWFYVPRLVSYLLPPPRKSHCKRCVALPGGSLAPSDPPPGPVLRLSALLTCGALHASRTLTRGTSRCSGTCASTSSRPCASSPLPSATGSSGRVRYEVGDELHLTPLSKKQTQKNS